ncbi:hypothetical protein AAULR_13487, partial [Lacticaseibacillus rhamnosus MTCC 5462]
SLLISKSSHPTSKQPISNHGLVMMASRFEFNLKVQPAGRFH